MFEHETTSLLPTIVESLGETHVLPRDPCPAAFPFALGFFELFLPVGRHGFWTFLLLESPLQCHVIAKKESIFLVLGFLGFGFLLVGNGYGFKGPIRLKKLDLGH